MVGAITTALMCLAISPGCGGPPGPAPTPVPSVSKFAISYERSGGLKADPRSLRIAPGRHATAEARWESARFRVGVKQVTRLRESLGSSGFGTIPEPGPGPGNCADCFEYVIGYRGHEVAFSQVDQPPMLAPVIDRLEALIEAHRPFH